MDVPVGDANMAKQMSEIIKVSVTSSLCAVPTVAPTLHARVITIYVLGKVQTIGCFFRSFFRPRVRVSVYATRSACHLLVRLLLAQRRRCRLLCVFCQRRFFFLLSHVHVRLFHCARPAQVTFEANALVGLEISRRFLFPLCHVTRYHLQRHNRAGGIVVVGYRVVVGVGTTLAPRLCLKGGAYFCAGERYVKSDF